MSLATRLLGANPGVQVSNALSGSLTTPGAKGAFQGGSMEFISTNLVSSNQTSITMGSIPQTYQDLHIRILSATNNATASCGVQFNDDTGSNYIWGSMYGSGSGSVTSTNQSNTAAYIYFMGGVQTTSPGIAIIDIMNYASTSKMKTFTSRVGADTNGSGFISMDTATWTNTSSGITSIKFACGSTTIAAGTRISIYGIKGSA